MREIKFRAKSALGGHWTYGLLTKKRLKNTDNIVYAIAVGNCSLAETVPVDENTIGEFTGFKDKNGGEIYDGDILNDNDGEKSVVYRTKGGWCNGLPSLVEKAGIYDGDLVDLNFNNIEVVGNIFDNDFELVLGEDYEYDERD